MPQKLKVDFFNGWESEKLILIFDDSKICEHCQKVGSFVEEKDPNVGLCLEGVKQQYTNIEVLEN